MSAVVEAAPAPRSTGDAVADLAPVTLAELDAAAALLTRTDRKYLVPPALAAELVATLDGRARALEIDGERTFDYESVYFDTPDLVLYRAAAHGRPHRAKVRTRLYVDSGLCLLEVKQRDRAGRTVKRRVPHAAGERGRLTPGGRDLLAGIDGAATLSERLRPTLTTRFTRTTLLLPDGRATLDDGLVLLGTDGRRAWLAGAVVVETKSPGPPTVLDRLLWARHLRPVRLSKYGVGLATLRPELPGNRWHRAVREHVVVD